jgi:hypothetical protein
METPRMSFEASKAEAASSPGYSMVHIAIQGARDGKAVDWLMI